MMPTPHPTLNVFAAGLLVLLGLVGCGDADPQPPRNLVLVVIDTLRADYLALHGGHVRTPAMEALAAEGVMFERAYSHIPSTGPSHASLFTGRLPTEHGVQANSQILAHEQTTLAEILQGAGYSTSAVVSLGVLGRKFGFHQGFESYDDEFPDQWFRNGDEVMASLESWFDRDVSTPYFLWAHFSDPHEPYAPADEIQPSIRLRLDGVDVGTAAVDGRAIGFDLNFREGESLVTIESADGSSVPRLSEHGLKFRNIRLKAEEGGEEPTLELLRGEVLLDALRQLETPSDARSAYVMGAGFRVLNPAGEAVSARLTFGVELALTQEQVRDAYAREIDYVDRQLAALVTRLKARGDWHETLLVLTSDHGEELFEHRLRGHVHQVYEPAMHVPLLMVAPGRLPAGRVIEEPVGHVDVLPTVPRSLGSAGTWPNQHPAEPPDQRPQSPAADRWRRGAVEPAGTADHLSAVCRQRIAGAGRSTVQIHPRHPGRRGDSTDAARSGRFHRRALRPGHRPRRDEKPRRHSRGRPAEILDSPG